MNLARLKMLEQFLAEEPHEPFNIYAVALEYVASDRAKARAFFDQLLTTHPAYIPTYYAAGNFFWEEGEPGKAIVILKTGLDLATRAGEKKTRGELQSLLDQFE